MISRISAVVSDPDFEIPLLPMPGKFVVVIDTLQCADMDMFAVVFLGFPFLPITL